MTLRTRSKGVLSRGHETLYQWGSDRTGLRPEHRELLAEQKVKMPDMVSVELNGQFLKRDEFERTLLKDGDQVELMYFMGGGRGTDRPANRTL